MAAGAYGLASTPAPVSESGAGNARGADLAIIHSVDARAATRAAIGALGGIARFVSRGDRVLVKPNIGFPRTPAQGANTHPAVVVAVVELCQEAGARSVTVADRSLAGPERCYRRSGIQAAAEQAGARVVLVDPDQCRTVNLKGEFLRQWPVWIEALEADNVINVPVAKNHSLCRLTMGMKNWFGMLGGDRSELHAQIHESIADLAMFFRPRLTVLDATRILIRNGPDGGSLADVQATNLVAAGTDPVAIDAFGASLFGVAPAAVGYITMAQARGLGTMNWERLRIARHSM